jgi:hypothetical protein
MTPTVLELLAGCAAALTAQPSPEDGGVFLAARMRAVAMLSTLVAQECAVSSQVRVWENTALRALLEQATPKYGPAFSAARDIGDGDYSLAALDTANAELRRHLIRLHEAVEAAADYPLDRKILTLYREMARRRELQLAPMPPTTR